MTMVPVVSGEARISRSIAGVIPTVTGLLGVQAGGTWNWYVMRTFNIKAGSDNLRERLVIKAYTGA